jgi:hypothetical protein
MAKKVITRRDFLRATAVAPLAGAIAYVGAGTVLASPLKAGSAISNASRGTISGPAAGMSRVILVRDDDAVGADGTFNAEVIQKMLDEAVTALFDAKNPVAAWKKIVTPDDTVGIKTNAWNALPTGKEIEAAIERRVLDVGVPAEKVAIADRAVWNNPFFQNATALINARPARVHYWAGMGSCLKNYIQFVPKPSDYHNDACADLATIWNLPIVKDKTKLNILVMLRPLYHNIGPRGFSEAYLWPYKGIIVGQDVVAVDATGYRIIQAKRLKEFGEEKPLETSAHHIMLADTRHHLGTSDPSKIELIKLGSTDGILI